MQMPVGAVETPIGAVGTSRGALSLRNVGVGVPCLGVLPLLGGGDAARCPLAVPRVLPGTSEGRMTAGCPGCTGVSQAVPQ